MVPDHTLWPSTNYCFCKWEDHYQERSGEIMQRGSASLGELEVFLLWNQIKQNRGPGREETNKHPLLSHFHQFQTFRSLVSSLWWRCPVIWERSIAEPAAKEVVALGTWWPREAKWEIQRAGPWLADATVGLLLVDCPLGFGFEWRKSPGGPRNCENQRGSSPQALGEASKVRGMTKWLPRTLTAIF